MRAGLVVLGVAVAIVGAGVLVVALYTNSPDATYFQTISLPGILGHGNYSHVVGEAQGSASVTFHWTASVGLQVSVYRTTPCTTNPPDCPTGAPVASWWSTSGSWSWSGGSSTPWYLELSNPNASGAAFSASFVETYATGSAWASSPYTLPLLLVGAVVLIGIGALAVFLGFFLRSGVYAGPGPLRPPPDEGILDEDPDDFEDDLDDDDLDR